MNPELQLCGVKASRLVVVRVKAGTQEALVECRPDGAYAWRQAMPHGMTFSQRRRLAQRVREFVQGCQDPAVVALRDQLAFEQLKQDKRAFLAAASKLLGAMAPSDVRELLDEAIAEQVHNS